MSVTIDYKRFGSLIKEARKEKELTQQTVCDELGISNTHYSNIENGVAKPSLEAMMKLVNYYNLPLSTSLRSDTPDYNITEEVCELFSGMDDSMVENILDIVSFAHSKIYEQENTQ